MERAECHDKCSAAIRGDHERNELNVGCLHHLPNHGVRRLSPASQRGGTALRGRARWPIDRQILPRDSFGSVGPGQIAAPNQ